MSIQSSTTVKPPEVFCTAPLNFNIPPQLLQESGFSYFRYLFLHQDKPDIEPLIDALSSAEKLNQLCQQQDMLAFLKYHSRQPVNRDWDIMTPPQEGYPLLHYPGFRRFSYLFENAMKKAAKNTADDHFFEYNWSIHEPVLGLKKEELLSIVRYLDPLSQNITQLHSALVNKQDSFKYRLLQTAMYINSTTPYSESPLADFEVIHLVYKNILDLLSRTIIQVPSTLKAHILMEMSVERAALYSRKPSFSLEKNQNLSSRERLLIELETEQKFFAPAMLLEKKGIFYFQLLFMHRKDPELQLLIEAFSSVGKLSQLCLSEIPLISFFMDYYSYQLTNLDWDIATSSATESFLNNSEFRRFVYTFEECAKESILVATALESRLLLKSHPISFFKDTLDLKTEHLVDIVAYLTRLMEMDINRLPLAVKGEEYVFKYRMLQAGAAYMRDAFDTDPIASYQTHIITNLYLKVIEKLKGAKLPHPTALGLGLLMKMRCEEMEILAKKVSKTLNLPSPVTKPQNEKEFTASPLDWEWTYSESYQFLHSET